MYGVPPRVSLYRQIWNTNLCAEHGKQMRRDGWGIRWPRGLIRKDGRRPLSRGAGPAALGAAGTTERLVGILSYESLSERDKLAKLKLGGMKMNGTQLKYIAGGMTHDSLQGLWNLWVPRNLKDRSGDICSWHSCWYFQSQLSCDLGQYWDLKGGY